MPYRQINYPASSLALAFSYFPDATRSSAYPFNLDNPSEFNLYAFSIIASVSDIALESETDWSFSMLSESPSKKSVVTLHAFAIPISPADLGAWFPFS